MLSRNIIILIVLLVLLLMLPFTPQIFSQLQFRESISEAGSIFLQPQLMSKPLLFFDVGDKGMVNFTVLDSLRRDPTVLPSGENNGRDIRVDLGKKVVTVSFTQAVPLDLKGLKIEGTAARAFVLPCVVDSVPYFTLLIFADDGRLKARVLSLDEYQVQLMPGSLGLTPESADRLFASASDMGIDKPGRIVFLASPDEAVRAASLFLDKMGAPSLRQRLGDMVSKGLLIAEFRPEVFPVGGIAVDAAASDKERTAAILFTMLQRSGIDADAAAPAFDRFWAAWQQGQAGSFDIDAVDPGLRMTGREIESRSSRGSNEGSLSFTDEAYTRMISLRDVPLSECQLTIADLKRVFAAVAEHEMNDHNAAVARGEKKHAIGREDMPGLDPDKIVIQRLSKCLVPTDIVENGGIIRINENFVRLLTKLKDPTLKGEMGKIWDYPRTRPKIIVGELYESILYSVAIHTIRGHFPVNEWGFAVFTPDEVIAQGQRGRKHLYLNTLAMMYYWIVLVEMDPKPYDRAEFLIKTYPHLFANLTPGQRQKLPIHLLYLCDQQLITNVWPFPLNISETGTDAAEVKGQMGEFPGSASNEGSSVSGPDGMPHEPSPIDVAEELYSRDVPVSAPDISAKLGADDPLAVQKCLDALRNAGIVRSSGAGVSARHSITGGLKWQHEKVLSLLMALDVLHEEAAITIKGELLCETETRWAHAILQSFEDLSTGRPGNKQTAAKRILAIETDWVPDGQKALVESLVSALERAGEKLGITVVKADSSTLASSLQRAIDEEGTSLKNVLVVAGKDTLASRDFDAVRSLGTGDDDKAFLASIDPGSLTGDSYIRLGEMLTAAIRMAYGLRPVSGHADLTMTVVNPRTIIFTPRAEPVDYRHRQEINDGQRKIFTAA